MQEYALPLNNCRNRSALIALIQISFTKDCVHLVTHVFCIRTTVPVSGMK